MSDKTETPKNKKTDTTKGDVRFRLISGLFFIVFSLILFLSFVSFLISWKYDLSIQDMPLVDLLTTTDPLPSNWMGRVGVLLSSLLILKWVGISAFAIIPILFFIGAKILGYSVPLNKIAQKLIFSMLYMSILLGYLFNDASLLLNGAHGFFISRWMATIFGKVGTGFVLAFVAIIILAFLFEKQFYHIVSFIRRVWEFTMIKIQAYRQKVQEQKERAKTESTANIDEELTKNQPIVDSNDSMDSSIDNAKNDIDNNNKKQNYQFIVENSHQEDQVDETMQQEVPIQPDEAGGNLIQFIESGNEPQFDLLDLEDQQQEKNDTSIGFVFEKPDEEEVDLNIQQPELPQGKYDPTLDLANYQFPTISLLPKVETGTSSVTEGELKSNKEKISSLYRSTDGSCAKP